MYIHKILIFILFLPVIWGGCATTKAPPDWLPEIEEVDQQAFGGWMTIHVNSDTINAEEGGRQYSGEFISVNEFNVYLLHDTIYIIPLKNVFKVNLELDQKNSNEYGLWTAGGALATISNGYFLIITAPLWLFGGIPATVGESSRDIYHAENPDLVFWEEIKKFARFPQGLPESIDLNTLEPKLLIEK